MAGIMQISTAAATGPGVGDLAVTPDPIPAFGWTHRWEAYAAIPEAGSPAPNLRDLIGTAHLAVNGVPGQTGATAPSVAVDSDGRYVLRFVAPSARLSAAYSAAITTPYTYVAVVRVRAFPPSPYIGIVMAATEGGSSRGAIYFDGASVNINAGSGVSRPSPLVADKVYVLTAVFNGADSVLRVSGSPEVTGNAGTGAPTTINVGAYGDVAPVGGASIDFIAGYVTPQALTLAQREQMETALRTSHRIS